MKVCFVVGHFFPHIGGVEKVFFDLAKGIQEKGHEIRVITSNSGGLTGNHNYEGINVYYYQWNIFCGHPICRKKDLEEHISWADIVHTTTFTVANPARKIANKYNKPVILTVHEVLGDKWNWIESNKIKAFLFRTYEKYVCCQNYNYIHTDSNSTLNDYIKYYGMRKNIERIYLSVDNDFSNLVDSSTFNIYEYFNIEPNDKVILYFGRPGQSKGIFVYLEAIKMLLKKYDKKCFDNVKFCFLLSNDPIKQRNMFINQCEINNLDEIVRVKPSVKRKDLFKCISDSDIVVIPSITEGFGFSAVEACMLKKKVIYSDGGSLPEVVSGECLSFKNRNSHDLSEKLYEAIQDDNAFKKIETRIFDTENMINKMERLYKKIINNTNEEYD